MNSSIIAEQKIFKEIHKKAKELSKSSRCLICGKEASSMCNSHVVPAFILREISKDGHIAYGYSLFGEDAVYGTTGINNAHTFHLICKKCDNEFFKDYESPNKIFNFDEFSIIEQQRILGNIAIKNHLSHIYSKAVAHNYYKIALNIKTDNFPSARKIDIFEHMQYIDKIKNYDYESEVPFQIIFNKTLDGKLNIASQTLICLIYDLRKRKVFEQRDLSIDNKCEYLYLNIFPYENKTKIIFYIEKENIGHNQTFIEDFTNLSEEEKIHLLFILMILYSEQFYINPKLKEIMLKDKKICELYKATDLQNNNTKGFKKLSEFKKYANYFNIDLE